jgi:WD40 repeat protein
MQLRDYLRASGLEPWLDTDDRIPPGERWRPELLSAIEASGSLLVIVTTEALQSKEVEVEVTHALNNSKPLIPLVLSVPQQALELPANGTIHSSLSLINFTALPRWLDERQIIDARDAKNWQTVQQDVAKAVRKDNEWRRRSTELLGRAQRWSKGEGALLSDNDLVEAHEWLTKVPPESAPPTELQTGYIRASEEARKRQLADRADRLADQVMAGFYDPDLAIPVASRNIISNSASDRAILALDWALRKSRSRGPIGPADGVRILRFMDDDQSLLIVYQDGGSPGLVSAYLINVAEDEDLKWCKYDGTSDIRAVSRQGVMILEDGDIGIQFDVHKDKSERLNYHQPGGLAAADFDSSGRWLLTANRYGDAWLWDMNQCKPVQELVPSKQELPSDKQQPIIGDNGELGSRNSFAGDKPIHTALSHDARYAAVGLYLRDEHNYLVTVNDTCTGQQVMEWRTEWAVDSLTFRPSSHDLLVACDGEGYLQTLPSGERIRLFGGLRHIAGALTGSPDGRLGAVVKDDGFVRIFEFASRHEVATVGGHDFLTEIGPDFSGTGLLVTGLVHGSARLWELKEEEDGRLEVHHWPSESIIIGRDPGLRRITYVGVSPDGKHLAATAGPLIAGVVRIDDITDHIGLYPVPAAKTQHLAWLADGSLVGIPDEDPQCVCLYTPVEDDYASEELLHRPLSSWQEDESLAFFPISPDQDYERAAQGYYTRLEVSADGCCMAVQIDGLSFVEIWSLNPLEKVMDLPEVGLLGISPDGSRLLLSSEDNGYSLWSVHDKHKIKTPAVANEACHLAAWAPAGGYYALAHGTSVSVVRDKAEPTTVELAGLRARILALAFSPCGMRVASGAQDGSLRVWDASTGAELRRFDLPGVSVTSVCFSADGELLISGSMDGVIRMWRLWTLEALLEMAEQRSTELSEIDCHRFGLPVRDAL